MQNHPTTPISSERLFNHPHKTQWQPKNACCRNHNETVALICQDSALSHLLLAEPSPCGVPLYKITHCNILLNYEYKRVIDHDNNQIKELHVSKGQNLLFIKKSVVIYDISSQVFTTLN